MNVEEKVQEIIRNYDRTFDKKDNTYQTKPHFFGDSWYLIKLIDTTWTLIEYDERNQQSTLYKGSEDEVLLYLLFLIIDKIGTVNRINEKERFKETYGYEITDSRMTYTKLLEFMDDLEIDKNSYSTEGHLIKNTFMIIMNGSNGAFYSVSGSDCIVEERRQFTKEDYSAFNSLFVVAHRKNELIKIKNTLYSMGINLSNYSQEISEIILPKSPYYRE